MASLDLFIVNVAFHRIGQSMGQSSLADLSWILNAYAIFFAAVLVPARRLVDRYGRKAGFLVGMAIFTCARLGCAVSVNLWEHVAFRCIQAIGVAVLTPSSLGLLLTSMPSERVTRSVRIWASSSSLAGTAGPVIGGILVNANWQWVFVINLPIGIVAFVAALLSSSDFAGKADYGVCSSKAMKYFGFKIALRQKLKSTNQREIFQNSLYWRELHQ